MQSLSLVLGLLTLLTSLVSATSMTYKLDASEKACFYAWVDTPPQKVAFYFAVQDGGSFDVDYSVTGPGDHVILDGQKERQGDYVFTAQAAGEYKFCFDNEMSTFAEKLVDFEIAVENEERARIPSRPGTSPEQASIIDEAIFKISGQLSTISRNQKYFRTRENRNFSTVRSTENRIFNFSIIEAVTMVAMAGLQVFVVKFFFQGARKVLPVIGQVAFAYNPASPSSLSSSSGDLTGELRIRLENFGQLEKIAANPALASQGAVKGEYKLNKSAIASRAAQTAFKHSVRQDGDGSSGAVGSYCPVLFEPKWQLTENQASAVVYYSANPGFVGGVPSEGFTLTNVHVTVNLDTTPAEGGGEEQTPA
ncbi:hypothetical protein KEM55_003971, partial [Ascosphaera atra]